MTNCKSKGDRDNSMNFKIDMAKSTKILKGLIISFLVIIGTFPENDWSFSIGADSPLSWVFNYLYENGLNIGKHIIFPHGPLAFFMYPLQENILISLLVTSLLKTLLVFNVFWLLVDYKENINWLVAFVVAYLISTIAGFNHIIIANVILLYCNYNISDRHIYKYTAFFITAFAFYVKSYVAIISGILCFSFLLYYLVKNKNLKKTIIDVLSVTGFILLFWLAMYGTFSGFLKYMVGMFHLAQDNSSAASYYPYNNWWILSLFILAIFSIPLINKTNKSFFYSILIVLSFYAAWKHGMARADIYHQRGFLIYTIISLLIFIIFHRNNTYKNLILSVIAIFLFTANMRNSVNYFPSKYELFRVNNFIEFVSDFSEIKKKSTKEIQRNISSNKLPQFIRDTIANSTIDVYPWDYSIIAANNLNWQPRIIIQSYASYTSWLDKRNAEHFNSDKAPVYLVWELDKTSRDVNGSNFSSIDNRYLLNDEPQTIVRLISNYDYFYSDNKFLLLKKRKNPIQATAKIILSNKLKWGEWVSVPESKNSLLRTKLIFKKSLLQRFKSFVYKDEQFWVYLKLKNGSIHKYRIVPKNAEDGIWINPYVFNSKKLYTVEQVLFKCSNQKIISENIIIDWEQTIFNEKPNRIFNFFNVTNLTQDSIIFSAINTYEELDISSNWNKISDALIVDISYLGIKSHLLKANSFSSTFTFSLDSIAFENLKITADCWVKSPDYKYSKNILLVLSIEDKNGNIIWKGLPIDIQFFDNKQWNNIFNFIVYKNSDTNCTLKAYLWNTSDKNIYIDNFKVLIMNSN